MYQIDKSQIKVSLTKAIEKWWEEIQEADIDFSRMPLVGENIHHHMATAALSVLESVDDAHEYLRGEDMLK